MEEPNRFFGGVKVILDRFLGGVKVILDRFQRHGDVTKSEGVKNCSGARKRVPWKKESVLRNVDQEHISIQRNPPIAT